MTRRSLLGICVFGALAVGSAVLHAAPPDQISNAVQTRMARDGVPRVVVVVLENGAPAWTHAFSFADPAARRKMTADALFRVESISKSAELCAQVGPKRQRPRVTLRG
jgi:CubicO group peptidase (beta-lactamase class C family)